MSCLRPTQAPTNQLPGATRAPLSHEQHLFKRVRGENVKQVLNSLRRHFCNLSSRAWRTRSTATAHDTTRYLPSRLPHQHQRQPWLEQHDLNHFVATVGLDLKHSPQLYESTLAWLIQREFTQFIAIMGLLDDHRLPQPLFNDRAFVHERAAPSKQLDGVDEPNVVFTET